MRASATTRAPEFLGPVAVLRGYWASRRSYQTFLYVVGVLLLISALVHGVVFLASGTSWLGPVSWRKPILFGFSFGITCITLAWIATFLPTRQKAGWALLGSFGFASAAETALISMQVWRGVPSHFNFGTAFDAGVFELIGLLVVVVAVDIIVMTIWCFRDLRAPSPSFAGAILAAMVLLIVGLALGGPIIAVGIPPSLKGNGASSVFGPDGVIFGHAGVMKDPHAIALHALQVIPALAWLTLFTSWTERGRRRAVIAVILGYSGVLAISVYQTYSGLAPFSLNVVALAVMAASVALVLAAYLVTLANTIVTRIPSQLHPQ